MAELLKVGVKADNGNAIPVHSDNNGNIQTGKTWVIDELDLFNAIEIRDRNWHRSHGTDTGALGYSVDLSKYGFINMRIKSSLDKPCRLTLCTDYNSTSNDPMCDSSGYTITVDIPANLDGWMAITPQDIPAFNCMKWIKTYLTVTSNDNPTSGSVTVKVYCKR